MSAAHALPLAGIRVVELTHMVMGPTCGMLLADLGADVIKIESPRGDNTRYLLGSGAGFFPLYNRNKRSFCAHLQTAGGKEAVLRLVATADIVVHNLRCETMEALGLDYASLKKCKPDLIYVEHRGFLPGPYEGRAALDEVVQMMGGLAYMTGRRGDPLRAGSSVNDMMGGIFGAVAAMAALRVRDQTGQGQQVQSALFENSILLVAQHMMQYQVSAQTVAPMPERISPWALYDVFTVKEGEQIFLSAVSDTQWRVLCSAFGWSDLLGDPRLQSNNDRVLLRDSYLLPLLRVRFSDFSAGELAAIFEANGLPFAPINKPEDLLDDPHLKACGAMVPIELPDGARAGQKVNTLLFPFKLDGAHLGVRRSPPRLGEHTQELLLELGYGAAQIASLIEQGAVRTASEAPAHT